MVALDAMAPASTTRIYSLMVAVARLARRAYSPYGRQILALTGLGFLSGILEGIGINAVIPLLTMVLGLEIPATDTISQILRTLFELTPLPFVPRYILGFIVLLFIGKAIATLASSVLQARITTEYERATREKLFTVVMNASWPYLLKQKLGNLETVLMVDIPAAAALLAKIGFTITLLTSLFIYLVVAFSISPVITLLTFILGMLTFVFLRPLLDKVHRLSFNRAERFRDTLHHVTEHVGGLKSVKAYGVEGSAIARAKNLFSEIKGYNLWIQFWQQTATQAVAPVGIVYIALLLAATFELEFISFAAIPAILYLIYRIFTYVQQLQNNTQYMSELAPHLERVLKYEDDSVAKEELVSATAPFIFDRSLSFHDVSFAYESGKPVLHDVSFRIARGEMVGIVGPSGAGKTTCVDLMLRLLVPTKGSIRLDDAESTTIQLAAWRSGIAYVSQDLFLLQDSIRNNIRFYDDSIDDEAVWRAAELARIDEFISALPDGLDTLVGERGIQLSAGERQRITIARALARKPQVLILDEATSALDNESEAHIKRVIEELKGTITIVAIAHRLSTIMGSDRLIILSGGRVVEEGSPHELLADQNSYFYKVSTINQ